MKFCVAIGSSVAAVILYGSAAAGQTPIPANTGEKTTTLQQRFADASLAQTITETADIAEQSMQLASTATVEPPAGELAPSTAPGTAPPSEGTADKNSATTRRTATERPGENKTAGVSDKQAGSHSQTAPRQQLAEAEAKSGLVRVVGKSQTGKAAWYGGRYVGRQTTSGERLDTLHATAAHRTLPLNSLVRVTNLKNGRSVVARITDRGPISTSLLIDMSPRAADELNMKEAGVVPVKIEQVVEVPAGEK
jgi:rare lipoprotein A